MINPLFERHPTAASLVGWMLTSYGELEYKLAELVGYAIGEKDEGLLVYFKLMSESARLTTAFTLLKRPMKAMNFTDELSTVVGAMRFCLDARNTYAHSHWASDKRLWFLNMQNAVKGDSVKYEWMHTNIALLRQQKSYFSHTSECITYLSEATRHKLEDRGNQNGRPSHVQWPPYTALPTLDIQPKKPVPAWHQLALPTPSAARPRKQTLADKRRKKAERKKLWKR